jgi:hypothetical protein
MTQYIHKNLIIIFLCVISFALFAFSSHKKIQTKNTIPQGLKLELWIDGKLWEGEAIEFLGKEHKAMIKIRSNEENAVYFLDQIDFYVSTGMDAPHRIGGQADLINAPANEGVDIVFNYPEMKTLLPLTKLYIEISTVYRLKGEAKIAIKRNPKAQTFVLVAE